MAIQLNLSKIEHKEDFTLDPASVIAAGSLERGMVMCFTGNLDSDGREMVGVVAPGAGNKVAGILWLSETNQATVPTIDSLDIPSAGTLEVTLSKTPDLLANVRAVDSTGAAITVVAGAPGAGELGLTGAVLTADAALAGEAITVTYRYTITPAELARRGGRRSINQGAEGQYGRVTLCLGKLDVQLSNFDTGATTAYTPATSLKVGANGKVTTTGAGAAFARCSAVPALHLTPGIEQAFIGVQCNLPIVP